MPILSSGDLTLVASLDLGALGEPKSELVVFHWNFVWNLIPLLPLVGLILLLFLRPNRSRLRSAVLVVLPPLLVYVGIFLYTLIGEGSPSPMLATSLALMGSLFWVWLAAMMLLSSYLAAKGRIKTLFRVVFVTLLIGAVGLECHRALDPSPEALRQLMTVGAVFLFGTMAVFLSLFAARISCRKRYRRWRFNGVFLLAMVVLGIWPTYLARLSTPSFLYSLQRSLDVEVSYATQRAINSVILSPLCWVLVLPFLLMALWVPFHRERFMTLLRLPSAQPADPPEESNEA